MKRMYLVLLLLLVILLLAIPLVQAAQTEPEFTYTVYLPFIGQGRCLRVPPEYCPWCIPNWENHCYGVGW